MENTTFKEKNSNGCLTVCLKVCSLIINIFLIVIILYVFRTFENKNAAIQSIKNSVFDYYDETKSIGSVLDSTMFETKWDYRHDQDKKVTFVYFTGTDPKRRKWKITFKIKDDSDYLKMSELTCDGYKFSSLTENSKFSTLIQAIYDDNFDFDPKAIKKGIQNEVVAEEQTEDIEAKTKESEGMEVYFGGTYYVVPAYSNESEDTYKKSCNYLDNYNNFLRYTEERKDKRYRINCVVSSVNRKGKNNSFDIYYCLEDDYFGYFYVIDYRNTDTTRILEGDYITLYGEFIGFTPEPEHPLFAMKYADISGIQH
ncbi:hypothetical protein SAMN05216349_104143 [Oribacterium sp. KHPX15]|uniref:hypothetical protein n=1 Tax=Oribacterium sp. KHPX15 TaxID=1855342 RepID=UPI00089594DD|nr:hypothetical protein [Oribacterium sp. KHPX15]SEA07953.1 hypothetical protein SAMN05216349_104143 [Oribacterium sp. KHPX15]